MSASLPMLALHENFQKQALEIRMALGEAGSCVVSEHIFYQRPDTPSLLQEFVWQTDDVFEPGLPLMQKLNVFEAKIAQATTLTQLTDIYEAWGQFAQSALDAMKEDSWQYLRPVHILIQSNDRALIAKKMDAIPFPNTRKMLVAWAKELDGLPREIHLDAQPTHMAGVAKKSAGFTQASTYRLN